MRREPLLISITTAGFDGQSICYEQPPQADGILKGQIEVASFFGCIRAAVADDDWTDPKVWQAANPSYGVTIRPDQFAEDFREAQQSPRKENAFCRFNSDQGLQFTSTAFDHAA